MREICNYKKESLLRYAWREQRGALIEMVLFCTFVFIIGMFAIITHGQEARVVVLDLDDSVEADHRYQTLQKAQADWKTFQESVEKKYLMVPEDDKDASGLVIEFSGLCASSSGTSGLLTWRDCGSGTTRKKAQALRKGWNNGFEFSRDFRFIVPKIATSTNDSQVWHGQVQLN